MVEQRTCIDDDGVERIIPEAPRKRNCSVCGKVIKPLMKCTRDPESWVWRECDVCGEPCCLDCSECDEETGEIECLDCYAAAVASTMTTEK